MSTALKPVRIGRRKFVEFLRNPSSQHIKDIMAQNFMHDEETQKALGKYFSVIYNVLAVFNTIINDFLAIVKANFEQKNPDKYLKIDAISCRTKDPLRCGTCLGKKYTHFPYIYISEKATQNEQEVKVRDWRDFFREYGLNDKQIEILFEAIDRRLLTLQILFNHSIQWLYHIGATDRSV